MATYQDGTFPSGSPVLTINSVTYKCNSFTYDKGSEVTQVTDENGAHSGALAFVGPTTGSAELQYAAISTAEPTTAAANSTLGVIANVNIAGTLSNVFITGVSTVKPPRGPWTSNITFQVKQN